MTDAIRDPESLSQSRILARRDWAPHLFSLSVERPPGLSFAAGQFVRLGVRAADGAMVRRAYSIASGPVDDPLEFYSILVPDGPFTPALARLHPGDALSVDPTPYGFLRVDRFEGGRHLWLLATGTGIAPFRSMLADPATWQRFDEIVVVHSVRTARELAYRDDFERWAAGPADRARLRYVPTLTDESGWPVHDRITALVADGRLEAMLGLPITAADARLMICGNPSMIRETRALLDGRGLGPVRRHVAGQYIVENFW